MGKMDGPTLNSSLSWQQLCTEFAPLPALVNRISLTEQAHEISSMVRHPAYQVLEQLLGEMTIVFSPPKVAGQTIAATLWGIRGLPEPHHIHFLSDEGFAFMEMLFERSRIPLNKNRWAEFIAHSRWVRVLLNANRLMRNSGLGSLVPKPVLIAGIREPMAQYLSLVFEHWWMYVDRVEDLTIDFFHKQLRDDPWRKHCESWFRNEMQETIGIDVFDRPFPTEQGWEIYENDDARLLVIRLENLDRLPQALARLYTIDPAKIAVESRNIGDEKDYSGQYNAIKNGWFPSEEELNEVYSPPQVQHFYSAQEIAKFRARWKSQSRTASKPAVPENQKPTTVAAPEATGHSHPTALKPAKHPHHPSTCRPCPQCASDIQQLPIFQKVCNDRLEIILKVENDWKIKFLRNIKNWYRRLFRWGGPVPR